MLAFADRQQAAGRVAAVVLASRTYTMPTTLVIAQATSTASQDATAKKNAFFSNESAWRVNVRFDRTDGSESVNSYRAPA